LSSLRAGRARWTKESNSAKNALKSTMRRRISTGLVEPMPMTMEVKSGGAAVSGGKINLGASFRSI